MMVESHAQANQALASGIHAVPEVSSAFAEAQTVHDARDARRSMVPISDACGVGELLGRATSIPKESHRRQPPTTLS